ncbi:MAG: hypothetical protein R3F14_22460 [Polyangiaceae bacterium]
MFEEKVVAVLVDRYETVPRAGASTLASAGSSGTMSVRALPALFDSLASK